MAIPALQAAKTLCQLSDWNLTNLELQKILYIAHMFHIGREGEPLVREFFEAWDYGPVIPKLYHAAKTFGNLPVKNVFRSHSTLPDDSDEYETIRESAESLTKLPAARLVAITHWDQGAWAKNYKPGRFGKIIPTSDILEEYNKRNVRQPA